MDLASNPDPIYPAIIAGPRGSGKTRWLIAHAQGLLAAGVPARRILLVAFSPRAAAHFAARLPAEADAETAGGVSVRTAQRLCASLWQECRQVAGQREARVFSTFERATLIHAAAAQSFGPADPLHAERIGAAGLAEIEALLEAIAGQGGTPDDLAALVLSLPATAPDLDRAALGGIAHLYRRYHDLCVRAGGVTYQEVAARAAALLADPALSGPIAARFDDVLIDDLERAEPAQLAVLARIATQSRLAATIDPAGLIGERGRRLATAARDLLGLEIPHPQPLGVGGEGILVATQPLDSAEAAYVARQARMALAEAARPDGAAATVGEPDDAAVTVGELDGAAVTEGEPVVLILAPTPDLRAPLLAALRDAGVTEAVDVAAVEQSYDPAVRYALAWLRAVVEPGDEHWERVLASPHAGLPAAELARLRAWARPPRAQPTQTRPLELALRLGARGDCDTIGDAARTRLGELVAVLDELQRSVNDGEAPSVTLHRLLAREDLVGALLVGPTDLGATPPDPRGLAALCALVARLEALWRDAYGARPALRAFLDRLEQSLSYLSEHSAAPATGRVVIANLSDAADWRARGVIIPGLCAALLPRPRAQSRLLSEAALSHLRQQWTLPWPEDFAAYAQEERRCFDQGLAAARQRLILTRARRYGGDDTPAPSPLLLDWLGVPDIDAQSCHVIGVQYDEAPRPAGDLLSLDPGEAARDLPLLLYRHAAALSQASVAAARRFMAAAREILAQEDAPAPARYLALDDPFAALAETTGAAPLRSHLTSFDLKSFLYCPRQFFYASQAGLRAPDQPHLSLGLLAGQVVKDLHRLHPSLEAVTDEDVEELLRLAWEGAESPEAEPDAAAARALSGRFGPSLQGEAALARVRGMVRRLIAGKAYAPYNHRTAVTSARVELPIALPAGRTVRVSAPVDRIAVRRDAAGRETLALIDYRSGAAAVTPANLVKAFLNRDGAEGWRPTDYTLPVMFLGAAANRAFYTAYELPPRPIRQLAVVSLGKEKDGRPHYCAIPIMKQRAEGDDAVTTAELRALRDDIARTVAAATVAPYKPAPLESFNPCRDCAHRFACPGPEAEE